MMDKLENKKLTEEEQSEHPKPVQQEDQVDFEQYIEDALEDADMQGENEQPETRSEHKAEKMAEAEDNSELKKNTREIMEIISQNELIEKAIRDRINSILVRQGKVVEKRTEILARLEQEFEVVNKKRKLAKAALKKAKSQKLDSGKIDLIRRELGQAKEARRHCKKLIREEKKTLKNIRNIIDLLATAG
ncbi:MAG: hypothetical protein ACLFPE_07700 [Bacteroidales bacterium]